jgi:hypothetical protein
LNKAKENFLLTFLGVMPFASDLSEIKDPTTGDKKDGGDAENDKEK